MDIYERFRKNGLFFVILLALALRICVNAYLGINAPPNRYACGIDAVEFEEMAWSAVSGNGFSLNGQLTAFRAPGFPFLVFALYTVFGRAYWAVHIAQILIGTASCYILYLLARQLTGDRGVGICAALICAVMPLQIYYTGHFLSETLEVFFSLMATYLICRATQTPSHVDWKTVMIAGIVNGCATLVRPVALLYPVVLGVSAFFWSQLRPKKIFIAGFLFAVGMLTTVLPWTCRNYLIFDRVTLVATNGGSTFWGANNKIVATPGKHWGSWISTNFAKDIKQREVLSLPNEVARDKKEWELGKRYLYENMKDIPLLVIGKYVRLINPLPESPNRLFVLLVAFGNLAFYPLLLYGLRIMLRRREHMISFFPVFSQLISLLFVTGIFYGSSRFRSTYDPFLIIYAAIALDMLLNRPCKIQTPNG